MYHHPHPAGASGGGHWSDHSTAQQQQQQQAGRDATSAVSEVFRDFTWYSAMLLSHIFALEHAQLERAAAAEESRRRAATEHSPQLLMSAAVQAVHAAAPTGTASATAAAAAAAAPSPRGDADAASRKSERCGEEPASATPPSSPPSSAGQATAEVGPTEVPQRLSHLTTQHRPHVLLGFAHTGSDAASATTATTAAADPMLCDPATRWTAPQGAEADPAAALLAVFDAYYFPDELFAAPGRDGSAQGDSDAGAAAAGGLHASSSAAATAVGGGSGAPNAAAAAPRVTSEALREGFHALLLLGQRCAAFALSYRGIAGCGTGTASGYGAGDEMLTSAGGGNSAIAHGVANMALSAAEDARVAPHWRGGVDEDGSGVEEGEDAAVQQAASATLQFLLQLSCSCPCAPLAYAAQLCLAHALAVQPAPRTAAGALARQQLLRYLPTLQPPSGAACGVAEGGSTTASTASSAGSPTAPTATVALVPSAGGSCRSRVPATQYVRPDDALLWFDAAGAVHVLSAQRWWDAQQHQQQQLHRSVQAAPSGPLRGVLPTCLAFCGPLPATTALPTVQRLLMEEEAYMGPNGSAAAVLKSVLDAVSTEVRLSARVITGGVGGGVGVGVGGGAGSSLVHTSMRRRRVVHHGAAAPGAATAGHRGGADAEEESAGGGAQGQSGSPALPATSAVVVSRGAAAVVPATRLSKAAKRRRALLFALAQSHLLPPAPQLATSKTLLYGVFTDGGECPSYYKLLSLYPEVLRAHHAALHYVLFEDGPLSVDVRLMVATMAASRHRCEYLVSRFSALLLRYAEEAMLEESPDAGAYGSGDYDDAQYGAGLYGGYGGRGVSKAYGYDDEDGYSSEGQGGHAYPRERGRRGAASPACFRGQARQRWITHGPPARLRAVQHFIALAAHTPWTVGEAEVRDMLSWGWTIPEVFQLVAIVAQVVPLCGFVMGLFVPAEPWAMTLLPLEVVEKLGHRAVAEDGPVGAPSAAGNSSSGAGGGGGGVVGSPTGGGGGMVSSGSSGALAGGVRRSAAHGEYGGGMSSTACPGPATPNFRSSASPTASTFGGAGGGADVSGCPPSVHADVYRRYAGDDSIVSEQRIKGGAATANPHTLWRSQFTWNEVGATSMEQYYPGAATLLNEEIECYLDVVRQLTKADCVGLMSPDYAPSYAFRSLQLYVQNLVGFMVEDYPYNDINKVLRRPAKWFAQVLTMRPETLSRSEVVQWYVPTTPPTGKASDMSAESSLVTHQLKREIELLSVVDSAQGGHRGGIESASAHPDHGESPPPTPAEAARDAAEAEALQTALTLQDERVLVLIALATMEARKEGLLHILLRPVCTALNNM